MRLLIWGISHGRLLTCDRLALFLQNIPTICCLCGEDDTLNHLFAGCPYSQEVWGEITSRTHGAIGLQRNVHHLIEQWGRTWTNRDLNWFCILCSSTIQVSATVNRKLADPKEFYFATYVARACEARARHPRRSRGRLSLKRLAAGLGIWCDIF